MAWKLLRVHCSREQTHCGVLHTVELKGNLGIIDSKPCVSHTRIIRPKG